MGGVCVFEDVGWVTNICIDNGFSKPSLNSSYSCCYSFYTDAFLKDINSFLPNLSSKDALTEKVSPVSHYNG